jgi:hypothetical protein
MLLNQPISKWLLLQILKKLLVAALFLVQALTYIDFCSVFNPRKQSQKYIYTRATAATKISVSALTPKIFPSTGSATLCHYETILYQNLVSDILAVLWIRIKSKRIQCFSLIRIPKNKIMSNVPKSVTNDRDAPDIRPVG